MNEEKVIHVGSRKSELALIQTKHVIALLKSIHPNRKFEIVTMSTLGDKVLDIPLPKIGEKSLFTKELEVALSTGCVDFVVHSLKDLPTSLPHGMVIGAVLQREDPRDALVLRHDCQNHTLETLPPDSVIGTSSLRRTAQLAKKYPHLKVENIRGNLNTRLKKLDELGKFHAIILAAAGLHRMGWHDRISNVIEADSVLYAVGQGALAVECREDDESTINLLRPLYDPETAMRIVAERSFLKTLGGGCSAPVAVTTKLVSQQSDKFNLILEGAVWSLDGREEIKDCDETVVEIKNSGERCQKCPFNLNPNKSCANIDIECLSDCKKRVQTEVDCPTKKRKLINGASTSSVDILKADPHDLCPVKLPVGVDFMGKCPYLESHNTEELVNINPKRCPFYAKFENLKENVDKCPFLNNENKTIGEPSGSNEVVNKLKLYTGLVPFLDIPNWALDEAENLGKRLAEKLIRGGAQDIMSVAQNIIRNT